MDRQLSMTTRGALNLNRSYNFVEKKTVIDELRTLMEDEGLSAQTLAERSDVCSSTLYKWFEGTTRSPRRSTLDKVARVFGKRVGLVDIESEDEEPQVRLLAAGAPVAARAHRPSTVRAWSWRWR